MNAIRVGHAHEKYRISCEQFDEMIACALEMYVSVIGPKKPPVK